VTYGEALLAIVFAFWFLAPPWRFRAALLLVLVLGSGLGG
jgi:hypothetical protein